MLYYLVAFGWAWSFWIAAIGLDGGFTTLRGYGLLLLGLLGPAIGGIVCARLMFDENEWRDYWARLIDPRRVTPRWWLVTLLFAPGLVAATLLIALAAGEPDTLRHLHKSLALLAAAPMVIAPFLLQVLLQGPLPEELGWRGYALVPLQVRLGAVRASLVLGAVWGLWHVPLFYAGHYGHAAWSAWFWLFELQVLATSVIMTWLFNNTRRSTLAAIGFHFTANLAYVLAGLTDRLNVYATLLWLAAAAIILASSGARGPATGTSPAG